MSDVTLYRADCLSLLKTLPSGSVDAIVADPPYGIGGAVVRAASKSLERMPSWDVWSGDWLAPIMPTLAPNANVIAFTDTKRVGELWLAMEQVGLRPQQIIFWIKHAPPPNPRCGFQSAVEVALWARKGKSIWRGGALTPNVWYEGPHKGKRSHPAEKPKALMQRLIGLFSDEGATILDPFMGSGTTGVACVQTGRRFIGIEISEEYFAIAQKRIAAAQAEHPLLAANA